MPSKQKKRQWIGEYPYVSNGSGESRIRRWRGGMEYPTITLIPKPPMNCYFDFRELPVCRATTSFMAYWQATSACIPMDEGEIAIMTSDTFNINMALQAPHFILAVCTIYSK
jgi:hypothetical protein